MYHWAQNTLQREQKMWPRPQILKKVMEVRLWHHTTSTSRPDRNSAVMSHSKPEDIPNLFQYYLKYSAGPMEPVTRSFEIFLNACCLWWVCTHSEDVVSLFLETKLLKGPALLYFMEDISIDAHDPQEGIQVLEVHFQMIEISVWTMISELSFHLSLSNQHGHLVVRTIHIKWYRTIS